MAGRVRRKPVEPASQRGQEGLTGSGRVSAAEPEGALETGPSQLEPDSS